MPKPISAFGYVSSDPGELSPRPMTDKSVMSHPHHTLPASVRDAHRGMLAPLERYMYLFISQTNC